MEVAISKFFNIDKSLISYFKECEQLSIDNCEIDINKIPNYTQNLGNYKTIVFGNVSFKKFNLYKILKGFGKINNNKLNISSNIIFYNCDILEWEDFDGSIKFENKIHFNKINKCCKLHFKNFNFDNIEVSFQDSEEEIGSIIFENYTFSKLPTIDLKNRNLGIFIFNKITFEENLDFSQYEFLTKEVSFSFQECIFKNKINFQDIKNIKKDINFSYSKFNSEANFSALEFDGDVDFSHCEFEKEVIFNNSFFRKNVDFSNSFFYQRAYFPWVRFEKIARFYNAYFKDIANFYFSIFKYVPNFSMCAFEKANLVNLIGVDLSLIDIEIIRDYIKEISDKDKQKNDNNIFKAYHYYLIQHSQGTKDSFRAIKSVLIAQNNLLESQKWHQLELYAQEVELRYRVNTINMNEELNKNSNEESEIMFKNNNKNQVKNSIDLFQLIMYRFTSNHHNDFLLILNWTLALICVNYCFYYSFSIQLIYNSDLLYKLITPSNYCLVLILLIIFFFYSYKYLIKNNYITIKNYLKVGIFIALLFFSIIGVYNQPSVITPFIGVFSDNAKNHFLNKSIINLEDYQAINIANRLNPTTFYLNSSQAKKDLLASKDIIKEDELILGAYNKTLQKGKNADEIMARINIIYYILMFLCLFSLQKTARKNSIIPN